MKICPKCSTGNDSNAVYCKDCGYTLSKVKIEEQHDYVGEIIEKQDKRHKLLMRIHNILLLVFGLVYVYIYTKAVHRVGLAVTFMAVLLPLIGYLGIHHPRIMFEFSHATDIDNIDKVELSDWYYTSSKIGGILCIALGFLYLIRIAYELRFDFWIIR